MRANKRQVQAIDSQKLSRIYSTEELNKEQVQATDAAQGEMESHAISTLLNVPSKLAKLMDTAVLLSMLTGILYIWGITYYFAFIKGLGLEPYTFAFSPPSNEVLIGGANTLAYLLTGVPLAYWSVGLGLLATIILIMLIQVVLIPALSLFLAPLAKRLWRWPSGRFLNVALFRKFGEVCNKLKSKRQTDPEYAHTVMLLWSSVELWIAHAVVWSLLLILLLFGITKSRELGFEVAKHQLSTSPTVEVTYGENEKIDGKLCGRIGSDFILKPSTEKEKYIIIKESTIKRIKIAAQAMQTTTQGADKEVK